MRAALEQALPEAFTDTGRYELRAFMERAVGDRKVARREAVRRAQLAADSRDIETGTRQALQSSPGQSASSLRAISISQNAPEDVPELVGAQTGEFSNAAPPRPRRTHKLAYLVAFAGVALALGVGATRLLPSGGSTRAAASGALEPGAPLLAPEAKPAPKPTALPAASPSPPPVAETPEAAPAPATTDQPSLKGSASSAPKLKATPASASAKQQKRTPAKKDGDKAATSSKNSDLLTPDYAR
jgi:hypothetical protein